jgi:glycosyltransferase involved in cell wall biosynthesis
MELGLFRDGPIIPQYTGGAVRFYNILKNLSESGMKCTLFQCKRDWAAPDNFRNEPYRTHILMEKDFYSYEKIMEYVINDNITALWFDCPEILLNIGYSIKKQHPEILLIYDANDYITELYERLRKPQKDIDLMQFYEFLISQVADKIFCVSRNNIDSFKKLGAAPYKLFLLDNGANLRPRVSPQNKKDICYIGNNYYLPNEIAVKSIKDVIAPVILKKDPSIKIFIIGGTPEYLKENAPENMIFLGQVPSLEVIHDSVRMGICPLKQGSGTRIKILEWMANGIPVVSSTLGAEGLSVNDGVNIILHDDINSFADKILNVYNNLPQLEYLSKNAYNLVENKYTWKSIVGKIIM